MCNGQLLLYLLDAHFVYSYKEHILCICYSFKNKLFLKGMYKIRITQLLSLKNKQRRIWPQFVCGIAAQPHSL